MGELAMLGRRTIQLWAGPITFLTIWYFLSGAFGSNQAAAIATACWMGLWWVLRPVHISVTAFLPIAINAVIGLVPMTQIISQYFSEIVILLLGSDLICMTWSKTGLDRRLSLKALCFIGPSVKQQIVVWFVIATLLSVFLPNVVVCSILMPVAVSMLHFIGEKDIFASKLAVPILLAIVWGAGIGGFGSPIGGAGNLVAISYLEQLTGKEFMYIDWFVRFLPFLAVIMLINLLVLFKLPRHTEYLPGTKAYFLEMYEKLGHITRDEMISLFLFVLATILAFVRPLYAEALPSLKPAYVFLLLGMLTFFIPNKKHFPFICWEEAEKEIMWGMMFLFAGGLALGKLIIATGAATKLAEYITMLPLSGGLGTILIFNLFASFLTEISSNTAAAAIVIPIVQNIIQTLALNPIPYIYISIVSVNCAYMLPVSIRAIPVSYGLNPVLMFRYGLFLAVLTIAVTSLLGFLFMQYLPLFSVL
ncbi:MAG: SLC13 family permease [Acidaminococcaceae bacterium]